MRLCHLCPAPVRTVVVLACSYWFVFRRFNLADPAVMSTLFPILEGGKTIRIPGTATDIVAAEGFRFFATQNDAM